MSSFALNFSVPSALSTLSSGNNATFNFYDTTGTGATGWNYSGNPNVSTDVLTASISILPYLSTNLPFVIDVLSNTLPFPNAGDIPFTVLGTSLGYSVNQTIPSQIVQITYNVAFTPISGFEPVTTTKYVYLDYAHVCCSKKLWAKWCALPCGTVNEQQAANQFKEFCIRVSGTIQAIPYSLQPDCLNLTAAQNMITWLNGVCAQYSAGCGCN